VDSASLSRVGATFEALILEQVLEPITQGNDAVGGYALMSVAQTIAERDSRGFGALLASRLTGRA
jgi:hypothetical protein